MTQKDVLIVLALLFGWIWWENSSKEKAQKDSEPEKKQISEPVKKVLASDKPKTDTTVNLLPSRTIQAELGKAKEAQAEALKR